MIGDGVLRTRVVLTVLSAGVRCYQLLSDKLRTGNEILRSLLQRMRQLVQEHVGVHSIVQKTAALVDELVGD